MGKIKQNQAVFQEDLEQVKGSIDSMKWDMSQVLLSIKNIIARQDEIPKVAFEEVAQTIGALSGHPSRQEPELGPIKVFVA